jgi:NodT family efflux transporter outer membrane factor (OMF) lipoprotein
VSLYRSITLVGITLVMASCAVGPDYRRPDVPQPTAFKEQWQAAAPADDLPKGPWWLVYGDPTLNDLEEAALAANQSIKIAEAQYRIAAASVSAARWALLPSLSVTATKTKTFGAAGTQVTADTKSYTYDKLTGAMSWEVDLWGQVRRALEQAKANMSASGHALAAAQLSAEALLAQDYVQLRALDVEHALLTRTITAYERSLKITRNRYAAGVAQRTDVTQAESQLASAQAQDADLLTQRPVLEHAIAVLTGRSPEEFSLAPATSLPTLPPLPRVIPATLLERRPDVAAAERQVASANAAVGIARAAWFPVLSLSANGGYESSAWKNITALPNRFWSLGPSLAGSILDSGSRELQNATASAAYQQAVASYRQSVLTALQDTEDQLAALHGLMIEEDAASRAARAAHETLTATENQYRAGTVSYLNVVIAESTSLSADSTLISVQSRRLLAHIGLLRAMGGSPNP